jgi:hypothetical protein
MFYDGGNSTISLMNCFVKNLISSCMRGGLYYSLNLSLEHNAEFINTSFDNITVLNATYGGLVYFVSSVQDGFQIVDNCSIKYVNMGLLNPNAAGGGVLCYASAPNSVFVHNSIFKYIRRPQRGGGIFLYFQTKLINQTVFANNIFHSLEAVNGGAIYTYTNVFYYFYII